MRKIYVYVRRKTAAGFSVYLLFKGNGRKFMLNSGLSSSGKFTGREFPRSEKNRTAKTNALNRMLLKAEEVCLAHEGISDGELKDILKREIFGRETPERGKTLADYIDDYAGRAVAAGTEKLYRATAKRVREFDGRATLDNVNAGWLERLERFLLKRGMRVNSVSIEMRNTRAVFNRAIDDGVTSNYPFRKYRIKSERTKKRNLTAEQIRQLRDYECEDWQREYRDLWLLQFYLIGINISDLLEMKSLTDGRCVYRRKKTGRLYDIAVVPEAAEIIERYRGKKWLLSPLDRYGSAAEYCRHMNRALKKIGPVEFSADRTGRKRKKVYHPLFPDLTTYWNRHSWATVAAELDIPKEVIGKALGHSEWDSTTTDIYINFDSRKIDEANRMVINYVNGISIEK